jgi:gluconokinase
MYAVGAIQQLEDVQSMIQIRDRHTPNLELSKQYREGFDRYQRLYYLLEPEFSKSTEQ